MGFGKPLGGASWNNKTEGANGGGSVTAEAATTKRPRKFRSTKALAGRTYRFQSLDSGESGKGE